jgi:hypothetical protein
LDYAGAKQFYQVCEFGKFSVIGVMRIIALPTFTA